MFWLEFPFRFHQFYFKVFFLLFFFLPNFPSETYMNYAFEYFIIFKYRQINMFQHLFIGNEKEEGKIIFPTIYKTQKKRKFWNHKKSFFFSCLANSYVWISAICGIFLFLLHCRVSRTVLSFIRHYCILSIHFFLSWQVK